MNNYRGIPALLAIVLYTMLTLLQGSAALAQADPGDEAANQESCTGTCSTCPGKAAAIVDLAATTRVLLKVDGLDAADEAAEIRSSLEGATGLQSCVAFAESSMVWLAFDAAIIDMAALGGGLEQLGFPIVSAEQRNSPMAECSEGCVRATVYVLLPGPAAKRNEEALKFARFAGVDQLSYDSAFNLLILDLNEELTDATAIRDQIVESGFAAGLPGEDLVQPAKQDDAA